MDGNDAACCMDTMDYTDYLIWKTILLCVFIGIASFAYRVTTGRSLGEELSEAAREFEDR